MICAVSFVDDDNKTSPVTGNIVLVLVRRQTKLRLIRDMGNGVIFVKDRPSFFLKVVTSRQHRRDVEYSVIFRQIDRHGSTRILTWSFNHI